MFGTARRCRPIGLALAGLLGVVAPAARAQLDAADALSPAFVGTARGMATRASLTLLPDEGAGGVPDEGGLDASIPLDAEGHPIFGVEVPIEDASGGALRAFHAALRRAAEGSGQAHVVVYGASHVAADVWPGAVRRALQARFGDAGPGFVLPAAPWRSYRHDAFTVRSSRRWRALRAHPGDETPGRYGLAGVAVETDRDDAWGRVDTGTHAVSRFELWTLSQPGGGSVDVLIDGERVARVRTDAALAAPAYATFPTSEGPHALELRARGDGPVTVFGVVAEREAPGVVVDTLGINGFRAAGQLLWDEALQAAHLRRRAPDLVVVAYGTNESGDDEQPIERYEQTLRQVLARLQSAAPMASCLLVGPSDWPIVHRDGSVESRARTGLIIEVQRRVAAELGCGFFDMVAFGGGPNHIVGWADADPPWAHDDHVHYTSRGYLRLGDVLSRGLLENYEGPLRTAALDGHR